jgi:hypothetical protein
MTPSYGSHDENHDGDIGRQEHVPAKKKKERKEKKIICIMASPSPLKSTDVLYEWMALKPGES